MVSVRLSTLVTLVLCAVPGCARDKGFPASIKQASPLEGVETSPADIAVLSGTTFRCGEVPCRLLGVKEAGDTVVRALSLRFTQEWFKSIGNYIGIYNNTNPLVTKDGTSIVWIRGYSSSLSCLSEELVRAGLVDIDDCSWEHYTFTVPVKAGDAIEDWRGILRKAKEAHDRGEPPHVRFDWPPK